MSRLRYACGEPGPYATHCTEPPGHRYSCYDASDDSSWNDRSPEDWQTEAPHECDDPGCTAQANAEASKQRGRSLSTGDKGSAETGEPRG